MGRLENHNSLTSREQEGGSVRQLTSECISGSIKNRAILISGILFGEQLYDGSSDIGMAISLTGFLTSLLVCGFGRATKIYFDRTNSHIEKFGKIDRRYFRKIMEGCPKGHFIGYCELQGMYLAARNHGLSSEFRKFKKESGINKVIPNI